MGASKVFSTLLSVVFVVAVVVLVALLFLNAVAQLQPLPDVGDIPGAGLTSFLGSWVAIAIGVFLVAAPLALILALNHGQLRESLSYLGLSLAIAAGCTVALGVSGGVVFPLLAFEWRGVLAGSLGAFHDFTFMVATLLAAAAAILLCVRATCDAAKGASA